MKRKIKSLFYSALLVARILFIGDFIILPVLAATSAVLHFKYKSEQAPDIKIAPQPEIKQNEIILRLVPEVQLALDQAGVQKITPLHKLDSAVTSQAEPTQLQQTTPQPTQPDEEDKELEPESTPQPFWRVQLKEGVTPTAAVSALADDPRVTLAEPNIIRRVSAQPNDTELNKQWHLVNPTSGINAAAAWDMATGSPEVVVAVIDTGLDLDHPDIAANLWTNSAEIPANNIDDDNNGYTDDVHGYNFVDDNGDPTPTPDGIDNDNYGGADLGTTHGTHVAGAIAAVGNNGAGVSGVAWQAAIMAVRVMDDEGAGTDAEIVEGIYYAVANGASIINMSLGGFGSTSILSEAISYAVKKGVLVVSAVGNNGINVNKYPFYPACYDGVLGISSTGSSNQASSFANFGSRCVDVSAPGENIYSTIYTNDPASGFTEDYGYMSGTSMAAPVVAGVAALVKSYQPALTRSQIMEIITKKADDVQLTLAYGSGRVDVYQAINGLEELDSPIAPKTIHAYANAQKIKRYKDGARAGDESPYFKWSAGADDDGISGYYVYFGTNKSADPTTEGQFQTDRTYQAAKVLGNEKEYYLRVASSDVLGLTSIDVATFTYIADTRVRSVKQLTASLTDDGIYIWWQKVYNEHVQKYIVRRGEVNGNMESWQNVATVSRQQHDYEDRYVRDGTSYIYKVKAVDDLSQFSRVKRQAAQKFVSRERVAVATAAGYDPYVRVFNARTGLYEYTWRAFPTGSRFGVNVAAGNLDDDRFDEIVVAAGAGGEPRVKVMQPSGTELVSFLAYESSFRGGVRVSVGDFDDDGVEEIVTVPGDGRAPEVKVFSSSGKQLWPAFLALDQKWEGGLFVSAVNWDGRGGDELAVAAGEGGGPEVVIYNADDGVILDIFEAYEGAFNSGVRLATRAVKNQTQEELVVVPAGSSTHVKSFAWASAGARQLNPGFFGFKDDVGSLITAGDLAQSGDDLIVVASGGGQRAEVRFYDKDGKARSIVATPFSNNWIPVSVAAGWLIE